MASRLIVLCRREVSVKTTLEGKPDVSKGTRPVWEGALGNQRTQRYPERPGGDSAPTLSCRKTRMAPRFYPHINTNSVTHELTLTIQGLNWDEIQQASFYAGFE